MTRDVLDFIKENTCMWDYMLEDGLVEGVRPDHSMQIRCTFHGDGYDTAPSARYYPDSDSYFCFACDQTYDIFEYLMTEKDMSFGKVVNHLLIKLGREDLLETDEESWNKILEAKPEVEGIKGHTRTLSLGSATFDMANVPHNKKVMLLKLKDVWPDLADSQRAEIEEKLKGDSVQC